MKSPKTNFNLLIIMLSDLGRNVVPLLLFCFAVSSAIAVILAAHHNRQLSIQYETLIQEKDSLDVEWRHLIIEQSALTEHNRIEQLVKQQLDMRRPTRDDEVLVRVK
ncbi:cell division protein FtsL [Glaciecola sp. KUL10]|uniref:cell division protein FtsL n=1 Tax=Glaciecola sp. (strain KUL10) TaxID=2161813 RepID=UPI000D78BDD0|nr:cell division protein FtsL [Glaciecola sp. KUL10]